MKLQRAYSLIEVKEFDEEKRELIGIASTPTPDRYGDIVEPKGAEFQLPIPFLWQHNAAQPIGQVVKAKTTRDGIEVKVKLAKIDEPGRLKERLDEAWQSIKHGLVKGLSIGFKPTEYSRLDDTGGYRFSKWLWLELSAVTIPANVEASIQMVKQIDEGHRASLRRSVSRVVHLNSAGDSAHASSTINTSEEDTVKNIQEQIRQFELRKAALADSMSEIMEKAAEDGRTLDAEEQEKYDDAKAQLKSVDEHLSRLRDLEKIQLTKATPASGRINVDGPTPDAQRTPHIVQTDKHLPKGIEFARYAMCLAASKGNLMMAHELAKGRFENTPRVINVLKAAVAAGTTTDNAWAGRLVEYTQFAGDFVEFLRPQTIIGRFGQGGIPALRSVPFNINIRAQTSGGSGYWVGQGKGKPLTKFDFDNINLGWAKVANIAVLTEDLVRFSNPSAEALVRDSLAAALIERLDVDFVDPDKAEVSSVSPASITNGTTPIPSSGNTADDIREDVRAAMAAFIAANISPSSAVWIMPATVALALSLMRNALGQREFPDITMNGGTFEGVPVITSEHVPTVTAGAYVILANASDIWLADDGVVTLDASREASLEMVDNPTQDATTGTGASVVSMFQTNSVAMRAERWINWKRRRSAAVQLISAVNWGQPAS